MADRRARLGHAIVGAQIDLLVFHAGPKSLAPGAFAIHAAALSEQGPPILIEPRPNACWSLDFVHDQLACGRRFRILNIVDETKFTHVDQVPRSLCRMNRCYVSVYRSRCTRHLLSMSLNKTYRHKCSGS